MKYFHGFNIEFWESLDFKFSHRKLYEGHEKKYGFANYNHLEFTLIVGVNTVAVIRNNITKKEERHAVFENEAIEWFSRESEKFQLKFSCINKKLYED